MKNMEEKIGRSDFNPALQSFFWMGLVLVILTAILGGAQWYGENEMDTEPTRQTLSQN